MPDVTLTVRIDNQGKAELVQTGKGLKGIGDAADNSSGKILGFDKRMVALGVATAGVGVAVLGAVASFKAISGAVSETLRQFGEIDNIQKLSRSIGVATETVSGFQVAATLSGTSTEIMARGFRNITRNATAATNGAKGVAAAFAAAGVSMEQLKEASPEEILLDIADSFAAAEDGSRKTAIAMKAIGEVAGPALISFLNSGSDGIRELLQLNKDLGLTVTETQAKVVESINDNIAIMGFAVEGVKRQFALGVAPAIEKVTGAIVAFVKETGNGSNKAKEFGATVGASILGGFTTALSAMRDFLAAIHKSGIGEVLVRVIGSAFESIVALAKSAGERAGKEFVGGLIRNVVQFLPSIGVFADMAIDLADALGLVDIAMGETSTFGQEMAEALGTAGKESELLGEVVGGLDAAIASLNEGGMEPFIAALGQLPAMLKAGADGAAKSAEETKKLEKAMDDTLGQLKLSNAQLQIQEGIYRSVAAVGGTVADAERQIAVAMVEVESAARLANAETEKQIDQIKKWRELALAAIGYGDAVDDARGDLEKMDEQTEKSFLGLGRIGDELQNSFNEVFDGIVAGTLELEDVFESFGIAVGKNLFNQILDEKFKFDDIFEGNILDLGKGIIDVLGGAFSTVFGNAGNQSGGFISNVSNLLGGSGGIGGQGAGFNLLDILSVGGSGGLLNIGGTGGGLNLFGAGGGTFNLGTGLFGGGVNTIPANEFVGPLLPGGFQSTPGLFAPALSGGLAGLGGGLTGFSLVANPQTNIGLQGFDDSSIIENLNNLGLIGSGAAGLGAGAALGATVGSAVPILGTLIGALAGAGIGLGVNQLGKGIDVDSLRNRNFSGVDQFGTSANAGAGILTSGLGLLPDGPGGAFQVTALAQLLGAPFLPFGIGGGDIQEQLFKLLGVPTLGTALRQNTEGVLGEGKGNLLNLDGTLKGFGGGGSSFDRPNFRGSEFFSPELQDIVGDRRRAGTFNETFGDDFYVDDDAFGKDLLNAGRSLIGEESLADLRGFGAVLAETMFGDEFAEKVQSQAQGTTNILTEQFASLVDDPSIENLGERLTGNLRDTFANLGVDAPQAFGALGSFAEKTFNQIGEGLNKTEGMIWWDDVTQMDFLKDSAKGLLDIFAKDLPAGVEVGHLVFDSLTRDGVKAFDTFGDGAKATLDELAKDGELWAETLVNLLEQGFEIDTEHLQNRMADIQASALFLSETLPGTLDAVAASGGDADDVINAVFDNVKAQALSAFQEVQKLNISEAILGGTGPDGASLANGALEPVMNVLRRLTTTDEFDLSTVTGVADFDTNLNFALALSKQNLEDMAPQIKAMLEALEQFDEIVAEAFEPKTAEEFFEAVQDRIDTIDDSLTGMFRGAAGEGADAIRTALAEGVEPHAALAAGTAAFVDSFTGTLRTQVTNSIISAMIEAAVFQTTLAPMIAELELATAEAMEDGVLTATEKANLLGLAQNIIAAGESAANELGPVFEEIGKITLRVEGIEFDDGIPDDRVRLLGGTRGPADQPAASSGELSAAASFDRAASRVDIRSPVDLSPAPAPTPSPTGTGTPSPLGFIPRDSPGAPVPVPIHPVLTPEAREGLLEQFGGLFSLGISGALDQFALDSDATALEDAIHQQSFDGLVSGINEAMLAKIGFETFQEDMSIAIGQALKDGDISDAELQGLIGSADTFGTKLQENAEKLGPVFTILAEHFGIEIEKEVIEPILTFAEQEFLRVAESAAGSIESSISGAISRGLLDGTITGTTDMAAFLNRAVGDATLAGLVEAFVTSGALAGEIAKFGALVGDVISNFVAGNLTAEHATRVIQNLTNGFIGSTGPIIGVIAEGLEPLKDLFNSDAVVAAIDPVIERGEAVAALTRDVCAGKCEIEHGLQAMAEGAAIISPFGAGGTLTGTERTIGIPAVDTGGRVERTGLALVHTGEVVVNPARGQSFGGGSDAMAREASATRASIDRLASAIAGSKIVVQVDQGVLFEATWDEAQRRSRAGSRTSLKVA